MSFMMSTPGPANMLMMSTGAIYGLRATLNFLMGLAMSLLVLNTLISFGLGTLLITLPILKIVLSSVSVLFFSYLSLKNWNVIPNASSRLNQLGFYSGLWVHILSPKAWMMVTLVNAQFISKLETDFDRYMLAPISFLIIQLVFHSLWGVLGVIFKTSIVSSLFWNRILIMLTLGVIISSLFQ